MALNKAITNHLGVTTSYHKIRDIELRKVTRHDFDPETNKTITIEGYTMNVKLFSYVSEDVRKNSESYAADRRQLILTATLEEMETIPCLKLAYDKLKLTDSFKDSTDC